MWLVAPQLAGVSFSIGLAASMVLLLSDQVLFYRWYRLAGASSEQLMTRSILFLGAFVAAALYLLTSSDTLVGKGLIVGMAGWYSGELLTALSNQSQFDTRFLWQVHHQSTLPQRRLVTISMLAFFGVLLVTSLVTVV